MTNDDLGRQIADLAALIRSEIGRLEHKIDDVAAAVRALNADVQELRADQRPDLDRKVGTR